MDKNRIKENIIIGSALILIAAVIFTVAYTSYNVFVENKILNNISTENSEELIKINEVLNVIDTKYIDSDHINKDDLVIGAIEGITAAVGDPYTRFVTNKEFSEMLVPNNEEYYGIGVHVIYDKKEKGILVVGVMPGSEAESQGMEAGDVILKVADIALNEEVYNEAIDAIKGEENTKVKLVIRKKDGTVIEDEYTRKKTFVTDLEYKVIDNNIGYVKINNFGIDVSKVFKEAIKDLESKNVSGITIDVRDNPGGNLTEVVEICKSILPKGEIVRVKYTDKEDKVYLSDGSSKLNVPLVVLVNENSASASEIFAGAVKDLKAGTIVGMTTFGKGIVQSVETLDSGIGAISVTTSKYYTASGNEIHKKGIVPDIELDLSKEAKEKIYIDFEEDIQLQKAIQILNK